jgi:hypothetical protein
MMTAGRCLSTKQPIKRSLPGRSRGSLTPRMDVSLYVLRDRAIQKSAHKARDRDNCSGWLVGRGDDPVWARPGSAGRHFNHKRSTKSSIVLINGGAVQHLCNLLRRTPMTAVANTEPPLNGPTTARRTIRISH